jgi:hypothetical protein
MARMGLAELAQLAQLAELVVSVARGLALQSVVRRAASSTIQDGCGQ